MDLDQNCPISLGTLPPSRSPQRFGENLVIYSDSFLLKASTFCAKNNNKKNGFQWDEAALLIWIKTQTPSGYLLGDDDNFDLDPKCCLFRLGIYGYFISTNHGGTSNQKKNISMWEKEV